MLNITLSVFSLPLCQRMSFPASTHIRETANRSGNLLMRSFNESYCFPGPAFADPARNVLVDATNVHVLHTRR